MKHVLARIAQPAAIFLSVAAIAAGPGAASQDPPGPAGPPPFGGPAGRGRSAGPPQEIKIVKQFDKDGDKRLNAEERKAAFDYLTGSSGPRPSGSRGPAGAADQLGPAGPWESAGRGPGRPPAAGWRGKMSPPGSGGRVAGQPGPRLLPSDVTPVAASTPLYDSATVRTLFLQFEDANWEHELMAFKNTDVEVEATLEVDGKRYPDVGVRFRGMSSFMMVPEGLKHSINLSVDFVHEQQTLRGYRTLNLLNSHEDPTYLRSILYYAAARDYLPAPKANYVRVAINGESWGTYVNVEQFNKDFVRESFGTPEGARWKVPGSPGGRGGLEYLGDDPSLYKRIYEIKSKDDAKAWADLIRLCRVLNQTPPADLEKALAPILDIDQTLKFLALDAALVNNDGYWVRASDYSIYEDTAGRFHVLPQDANETFSVATGPGGRGGRRMMGSGGPAQAGDGGRSPHLDPLVGLHDTTKPLRSKLFAVPALRARYLAYVRDVATKWLDWGRLGPLAEKYQALIADDVKTDTRKLDTFEAFRAGVTDLKSFAEARRAFLLGYKESATPSVTLSARPSVPRTPRPRPVIV